MFGMYREELRLYCWFAVRLSKDNTFGKFGKLLM